MSKPYFEEQHYRSSEESCDKAKTSSIALSMKEPSFRFPFCLVCQQNVSRLQQQATPKFQLGLSCFNTIISTGRFYWIKPDLIQIQSATVKFEIVIEIPKKQPKKFHHIEETKALILIVIYKAWKGEILVELTEKVFSLYPVIRFCMKIF